MRPGTSGGELGAYGLRLSGEGLDSTEDLLVRADPTWPELSVQRTAGGPFPHELDRASDTEARFHLENGGVIEIDFPRRRAIVTTPKRIGVTELVHPYLAPIAAMLAYWLDRESFHAGAFAVGGRVWALFGERGSGKSSTLGWLAQNGVAIVCDDMLVLDGRAAFAGPRAIDLREDVAELLGAGEPLGMVGARERWRLTVPQVDGDLRLEGAVFLTWGAENGWHELRASGRLARLIPQRGVRIPPRAPEALMEIAELPAWELRRERRSSSLEETGTRLLELASTP